MFRTRRMVRMRTVKEFVRVRAKRWRSWGAVGPRVCGFELVWLIRVYQWMIA